MGPFRDVRNERVRTLLSLVKGTAVLHLGCVNHKAPRTVAEERNSLHCQLVRHFLELHILGMDIDEQGIEQMRLRGLTVTVGDAQALAARAEFDTVLAGELIEHLENPGLCLERCRRALKPGGRLLVSTPNVFSVMLALMYLKDYDKAFNPEHSAWFCPQTLRELVSRSGLRLSRLLFVDDLEPELVDSRFYKAFCLSWKAARPLLPRRYRNTMVGLCELP